MNKIHPDKIIIAFLDSVNARKLKENDPRVSKLVKILKKNKISAGKFKKLLLAKITSGDKEHGTLYSSFEINQKTVSKISKAKNLEIEQKLDPSLIGGIKIITNTKLYDYTIANNLKILRENIK